MSMTESTEKYLESAWWLDEDQYQPLKSMLILLAKEIDGNFQTSTTAEWNRAYRHSLSLKPDAKPEIDPLEELLKRDAFSS